MAIDDDRGSTWLGATFEHEGHPLMLRVRPDADTMENRAKYPNLVLISHALSLVRANGLPQSDYNDTLAEFDHNVHSSVEHAGDGLVILIETFSGKRNYYAYVTDAARLKTRFTELQARHPEHSLTLRGGLDSEWALYTDYRRRFPWSR